MARWTEIPAHRILELPYHEFKMDFERLNEHGAVAADGEMAYRVVRKKDGKMFKPAAFLPWLQHGGVINKQNVYLDEM